MDGMELTVFALKVLTRPDVVREGCRRSSAGSL